MQAIKEKLHDLNTMRKAKAEAKAEEKAHKELAKARVDIAREVRLAREAEAEMELHVAKAGEMAEKEIAKHVSEDHKATAHNALPGATAASPATAGTTATRSFPC
ncbi:late embryogenesis abundant protein 6 [Ricinus communis]|uniref:Late embryogenesis abundant protein n=1 Tax=Ricinus communis TaxID=3988 RepID=B9SKJ7_RICCO|nr:late embryogenesis abundant protein 6 [Ricinus communis]EEF35918.1 conserved hypothetical protein [Ricinus communis]|eukprot:XP_002526527.1 late embryogenesis abundant protein 6 [Ricinus communis]